MKYLFYRVQKEDIFMIKFLIESYDNMMVLSTIDKDACKIQITIAPDFFEDCLDILNDLKKKYPMERLEEPDDVSQGNY